MAGMFAGHEHAARRSADVVARVVLGEFQTLGGETIKVGRPDNLLAERADVAVAEIVGEDEDDVRRATRSRVDRCREGDDAEGEREKAEEGHGDWPNEGRSEAGWCGYFSSIRGRAVEACLRTSRRGNSPAS